MVPVDINKIKARTGVDAVSRPRARAVELMQQLRKCRFGRLAQQSRARMGIQQQLNEERREKEALQARLRNVEEELEKARGGGTFLGSNVEAEMLRKHQEQLEAERMKRVEHLANVGLKRILKGDLAKGWSAWHEMWEEKTRQQRMLAASASRLAKPKLVAGFSHWRKDWEAAEDEKRKRREAALQDTCETVT